MNIGTTRNIINLNYMKKNKVVGLLLQNLGTNTI